MRVHVDRILQIQKKDRGLGGFLFAEIPVEPFVKDFNAEEDGSALTWERFDLSKWAFFMAFDDDKPVGGAAVATRTKELNMLQGREDIALLWDIRVDEPYKRRNVGQTLFDMAIAWSRTQSMKQLKIECQNDNIPAVRFYHKQGAALCAVDEYAYADAPLTPYEIQLIWYLEL